MNIARTEESMKTKTVDTAKVVLELYDLKFVLSSDDLEKNDWVMEVSYPDYPNIAPRLYEIDELYTEDESEMIARLWEEAFWYIKKYHRGPDTFFESKEVEEEEE